MRRQLSIVLVEGDHVPRELSALLVGMGVWVKSTWSTGLTDALEQTAPHLVVCGDPSQLPQLTRAIAQTHPGTPLLLIADWDLKRASRAVASGLVEDLIPESLPVVDIARRLETLAARRASRMPSRATLTPPTRAGIHPLLPVGAGRDDRTPESRQDHPAPSRRPPPPPVRVVSHAPSSPPSALRTTSRPPPPLLPSGPASGHVSSGQVSSGQVSSRQLPSAQWPTGMPAIPRQSPLPRIQPEGPALGRTAPGWPPQAAPASTMPTRPVSTHTPPTRTVSTHTPPTRAVSTHTPPTHTVPGQTVPGHTIPAAGGSSSQRPPPPPFRSSLPASGGYATAPAHAPRPAHPAQGHPAQGHPAQGHPAQGHPAQGQRAPASAYPPSLSYGAGAFAPQSHGPGSPQSFSSFPPLSSSAPRSVAPYSLSPDSAPPIQMVTRTTTTARSRRRSSGPGFTLGAALGVAASAAAFVGVIEFEQDLRVLTAQSVARLGKLTGSPSSELPSWLASAAARLQATAPASSPPRTNPPSAPATAAVAPPATAAPLELSDLGAIETDSTLGMSLAEAAALFRVEDRQLPSCDQLLAGWELPLPLIEEDRPKHAAIHRRQAQDHLVAGEPQKALHDLCKSAQLDPGGPGTESLASVYLSLHSLEHAETWVRRFLAENPRSDTGRDLLGDIQSQRGKVAEARATWLDVLGVDADATGLQREVAKHWVQDAASALGARDLAQAERKLRRALTLDPSNSGAALLLARVLERQDEAGPSAAWAKYARDRAR